MEYWQHSSNNWSDNSIWITLTPSDKAKKHLCFVQEAGYFETIYPYFTRRVGLSSFLLLFTLSGTGHLEYKEKCYTVKEDQAFFINSRQHQKYWASQHEGWTFIWLHVDGGMVDNYHQLYESEDGPVVQFKRPERIQSMMRDILSAHQQKKTVYMELEISKKIVELITEFVKEKTPGQNGQQEMPTFISDLAQKLEEDYAEKWTLDRMAKFAATNKYQLAKEFKYFTGFSPNEYVINRRINAAKEKLKQTNQTVKEISGDIGIENTSHFINLFKQREGMTPLLFRKTWS